MKDKTKTKRLLIQELVSLRERNAELERFTYLLSLYFNHHRHSCLHSKKIVLSIP